MTLGFGVCCRGDETETGSRRARTRGLDVGSDRLPNSALTLGSFNAIFRCVTI